MYIRRKVFSLLQDENGEERYFSTTEFTDERLYAEKEEKEESTGKKIAKGAGIVAGTGVAAVGGYQGVHAIRKHLADKAVKNAKNQPDLTKAQARRGKIENEGLAKEGRKVENTVTNAAKNVAEKTKETATKVKNATVEAGKKTGNFIRDAWEGKTNGYTVDASGQVRKHGKFAKERAMKKNAYKNRALMIGTPVVLTAGGIAAKKIAKNRKEKSED